MRVNLYLFLFLSLFVLTTRASVTDTIDFYQAEFRKSTTDSSRVYWLLKIADQYQAVGMIDSANTFLDRAGKYDEAVENEGLLAKKLTLMGQLALDVGLVDSAQDLLEQAEVIANRSGYEKIKANIYNTLGRVADHRGDLIEAKNFFEKAKSAFANVKDSLYVAGMDQNIAVIYSHLGLIDKALKSYLESLKIYEKKGSPSNVAVILNNIGLLYADLGETDAAQENLNKAIGIAEQEHDFKALSMSYLNLAILHSKANDHEKALEALEKAESSMEDSPLLSRLVRIYYNRGYSYLQLENVDSALENFNKCLELSEENGFVMGIAYGNLGKGMAMKGMQRFEEAEECLGKTLELGQMTGDMDTRISALLELAEVHKAMGNFQKALEYAERHYVLKDSVLNQERTSTIARLKTIYETEQKEQENLLLKKDQQFKQSLLEEQSRTIQRQYVAVVLISVALLIVLITLWLFFKQKRVLKRAMEKMNLQNLEIRKQQAELKELNATKDRFFSIIAHDLKSPFNALIGFTSVLEEKGAELDQDKRKSIVSQLRQASLATYELLENLLSWAASQRGNIHIHAENFHIHEVVLSNLQFLKAKADAKGVGLENRVSPDLQLYADRKMTGSVLRNLLSNAIKFSHPGSIVIISAKPVEKRMVEVSVTDSGVGISAKDQDELFKIDKRVSRPGTSDETGTGLGLILCHEFIQLQKGKVNIESEEGKGTTVSFILPMP